MNIKWINKDLETKIKKVFEPRYGRELSDNEIHKIAENLASFMKVAQSIYLKERSFENV